MTDPAFDYPAPSHIAPGEVGNKPSTPPRLAEPKEPVWGRQEGENDLWYGRFTQYCALGPTRSVSLAATGRRNAYPLPSHWSIIAKDYRWRERAQAYDAAVATGSIEPFADEPPPPTA